MGTYDDWKTRSDRDEGPQEEPEEEPIAEETYAWAVVLADYINRNPSHYRLIDRIAVLTKLTGRDLETMVELVEEQLRA